MVLNNFECNCLTPLHFKGLKSVSISCSVLGLFLRAAGITIAINRLLPCNTVKPLIFSCHFCTTSYEIKFDDQIKINDVNPASNIPYKETKVKEPK